MRSSTWCARLCAICVSAPIGALSCQPLAAPQCSLKLRILAPPLAQLIAPTPPHMLMPLPHPKVQMRLGMRKAQVAIVHKLRAPLSMQGSW